MASSKLVVLWFERDIVFRRSMIRLLRQYARPSAELVFLVAETIAQAHTQLHAGVDRLIVDVSAAPDGSREGLAFLELARLRFSTPALVISDDLTTAISLRVHALRAIPTVKRGAFFDVRELARALVACLPREPHDTDGPNQLAKVKPTHDQILDQLEEMGGTYAEHQEALDKVAIARALDSERSLQAAAKRLGMPRQTVQSKVRKLGFTPPSWTPRGSAAETLAARQKRSSG